MSDSIAPKKDSLFGGGGITGISDVVDPLNLLNDRPENNQKGMSYMLKQPGAAKPNSPPSPPLPGAATNTAIDDETSAAARMRRASTLLTSPSGLLDQQPQTASRVLLGY